MSSKGRIRLVWIIGTLFFIWVFYLLDYFIYPPVYTGQRTTNIAFIIVAGFAFLSNFGIIYYHATVPPHPKFLMLKRRKFFVRLHAISGASELILGIIAWFTMDKDLAMATAIIVLAGHVPSGFFQSTGTFGAKGINLPAYLMCNALHGYCAVRLLMEGGDILWLERTWIVLQAYAFMRIYMFVFDGLKVFKGSHYTVTLLLSAGTFTPFVFGYAAPLAVFFGILIYLGIYKLIVRPSAEEWEDLFEEKERESLIDNSKRDMWLAKNIGNAEGSSFENARLVFDHIDKDKSGFISLAEIEGLGNEWGISADYMKTFYGHHGKDQGIDYKTFVSNIWILGANQEEMTRKVSSNIENEEEQSKVVFNHLDVDGSGTIDSIEVEMLLQEWGIDAEESKKYMEKYAGDDAKIDFTEFYEQMKPIWRFGYKQMFA